MIKISSTYDRLDGINEWDQPVDRYIKKIGITKIQEVKKTIRFENKNKVEILRHEDWK